MDSQSLDAARAAAGPQHMAFVVGAPRCGTTSLARVLRQHPDVCFSAIKEPHYFSRQDFSGFDDAKLREVVEREYVQRFFGRCTTQRLGVEASPTYLYTPEKMLPVLRLWPDAKFIVALRDPLAMVPSLHSRLLVTGDETVRDFATAWSLVPERSRGHHIPRSCIEPLWLRYDLAAAFATHLERFFATVGRDRCQVILIDDLAADPRQTYAKVCSFLGIQPWAETDFTPRRENRAVRFGWVQRLLHRPPRRVLNYLAGEAFLSREGRSVPKGAFVPAVLSLRKRILKWNEVSAPRPSLPPALRDEIIGHYRAEVTRLADLIGRDLSHWLSGKATD